MVEIDKEDHRESQTYFLQNCLSHPTSYSVTQVSMRSWFFYTSFGDFPPYICCVYSDFEANLLSMVEIDKEDHRVSKK